MKEISEYFEELKIKLGSDYAVAKALGITRQSVCIIKKGGGVKDETAIKAAELLELDPGEVLLAAAMARSEGAVRSAWESVSKRAGIAASLALAVVMTSGFSTGNTEASTVNNIHYAKL
ncbi:hypothetical protein [Methylomonas methanica]|uniref:HTH cro/C1-type domain-containing protein n=1 Tax=Methylomonas methanica (strain DSM 25384 / MC09) TaxID=857087 RepID=F9ZVD2_METMM|nr:hypothetical protein [Methylomonas methanica]AEG00742.1 hypothetical protein Metme_2341 [Methylomonas methanica MC09]